MIKFAPKLILPLHACRVESFSLKIYYATLKKCESWGPGGWTLGLWDCGWTRHTIIIVTSALIDYTRNIRGAVALSMNGDEAYFMNNCTV